MTTLQNKLSRIQLIYNSIHKQSELTPRLGSAVHGAKHGAACTTLE